MADRYSQAGRNEEENALIRTFTELKNSQQWKNSMVQNNKSVASIISQKESQLGGENKTRHHASYHSQVVQQQAEQVEIKRDEYGQEVQPDPKQQYEQKVQQTDEAFRMMDDHRIPLEELRVRMETDFSNGLTEQQAAQRNIEYGDNKLTEKKKTPAWIRLLKEMTNWFSIMLWVGAALCVMAYCLSPDNPSQLYLGLILILVVIVTGLITFNQTAKSEAMMEGFKNFLPQQCTVIRDGTEKKLLAEKLVPGDIVLVKMGEKTPADIRILQSAEMKVDNSALTGESDPLLRKVECTHPENPLETSNLAFFGTLVKEGRGKGIVVRIGDNTVLGQIANLASTGGTPKTPLRIELDRFVLMITIIAIVLGVVFFLMGYFVMNYPGLTCIVFGIGILVANVPEGLLGCITISLAITAKRLAERQVLVKNLEGVETLGSTSCICSDKTGTLTQNKMTVEHVWYDGLKRKALNKEKFGLNAEYEYETDDPAFRQLHDAAIVASEAKFDIGPNFQSQKEKKYLDAPTMGDASESALIKFFQPIEDIQYTRDKYKIVVLPDGNLAKLPFNSTNKYALIITEYKTDDSEFCIYIKGAPEKIWKFCTTILIEGHHRPIDQEWHRKFEKVNLEFGKNGERVLGFAKLHLLREYYPKGTVFNVNSPEQFNFQLTDFTFLGLISLMDPPKDTVPFAVLKCRSAGIKVIMVTGDQPPTASAIARQVNIIPSDVKTVDEIMEENEDLSWEEALERSDAIVVHGDRLNKVFEDEIIKGTPEEEQDRVLREWVKKPFCVFARTSPAQKLKIVRACQRVGYIVGVTGDGVNDSPAIKQGDIGISMGITGSDVTKDAADMILLNDDFASIVDGVEEGRKIFDNLKKTVTYLLTSNVTEILPFLAFIMFKLPLPLSSVFMLCICVGTDILPALSLAYEDAELDIMTRKPRKRDDHLVSAKLITHAYLQMGFIATAGGFFAYASILWYYGFTMQGIFGMTGYNTAQRPFPSTSDNFVNYDPTVPWAGNPNLQSLITHPWKADDASYWTYTSGDSSQVDWIWINDSWNDLRGVFVTAEPCDQSQERWPGATADQLKNCQTQYVIENWMWRECERNSDPEINPEQPATNFQQYVDSGKLHKDPITGQTPCYHTEALYYAQSGYFVAIVFVQWSNIFVCKCKKQSLIYSSFNRVMIYGIVLETAICFFLLYTPGVQKVFGARPLSFFQFAAPAFIFSMMLMVWDESRKYLIRNAPLGPGRKINWFDEHLHW